MKHVRSAGVSLILLACCMLQSQASTPAGWPQSYPDWWYNSDPTLSLIDITKLDSPANEAPLVQGQLWFMADRGIAELDTVLAPVGGAGFDLSVFSNGQTPVYRSISTIGQLKFVSSKFFDRFAAIGFTPTDVGWPSTLLLNEGANDNSLNYPWLDDVTSLNASPAVIGQAKHLFSWDLRDWFETVMEDDLDLDGYPDFWEDYWYPGVGVNGASDTDGDQLADGVEFHAQTDPLSESDPFSSATGPEAADVVISVIGRGVFGVYENETISDLVP